MNWRIGSVPHLNARPLIYGIEPQVTLLTPARLADAMHRREFDVGLVPVAEVLRHDQYDIVDGIAVASFGPVRSVFLVHRNPVEQIRNVYVDPASRSSVWLLRVLLAKRFGIEPEFHARATDGEATLVFGDNAINRIARHPEESRLDLGAAWTEWTGLPFVYAVWAAQREAQREAKREEGSRKSELLKRLKEAKVAGLARIEEVVAKSTEGTPEIRREYLTKHIRYDLGEAEKNGLRKFQECLQSMNLVKSHELRFVG